MSGWMSTERDGISSWMSTERDGISGWMSTERDGISGWMSIKRDGMSVWISSERCVVSSARLIRGVGGGVLPGGCGRFQSTFLPYWAELRNQNGTTSSVLLRTTW